MDFEPQSLALPVVACSSEALEPAAKRRRLDADAFSHRPGKQYENTTAQGNSRNVYGDVNNTYHVYPPEQPGVQAPPTEVSGKDAGLAASLMEALAFDQMDARFETISTAHAKTCQWLFKREEYKTWRDPEVMHRHNGFFWIKGKPGAGKSTLMKSALRYGEKAHEDLKISFFFNARGEELQRSLEGMYRSLLYQLLDRMPHLSAALPKRREHASRKEWRLEVLKDMFEAAILALGSVQVTCYVDALDECDDEEARAMAEFFESLGEATVEARIGFRVLMSSRHYPHITIENCLRLDLEGQEGHEADIAEYIRCKLKIGRSKLASQIRTAVRTRASGVFLWVVLVIRILNECDARGKTHLLEKRLETIPDGLSKLFQEILQRGAHDLSDTLLTFQWMLFARRPLQREELYFAVATDSSSDDIEDWIQDEITVAVMERFLLDASKGLAEMTKSKYPKVQFIHESVKEYLLSTGLATLQPELRESPVILSHDRLRQCCCHYLERSAAALLPSATDGMKDHMSRRGSSMKKLRDRIAATHPFLSYAMESVMYHANLAHSSDEMHDVFVAAFPHRLWRRYYNICSKGNNRRLSDHSELVYAFVLMGAPNLADAEIRKTPSHVSKPVELERYHSLLKVATDNSDHSMLGVLLEHGADVNHRGDGYTSCLALAIVKNDSSLVRTLLNAGADPTRSVYSGKSMDHLSYALLHFKDSQEVLESIWTHRSYSNATYWSDDLSDALCHARCNGLKSAETLLLAKLDAIVNDLAHSENEATPQSHGEAFLSACSYGTLPSVQVFIKHGILRASDMIPIALGQAACNGQEEVVRELLDHGVEPDLFIFQSRDVTLGYECSHVVDADRLRINQRSTALIIASERCHGDIVKLLINRKANVNHLNMAHHTALHAAAVKGHSYIVQMLLDFGADPNARGDPSYPPTQKIHSTALHMASMNAKEEVVRVLLSHANTDADALDGYGHHAIYLASKHNNIDCVQALLERDIPPEHLNNAMAGVSSQNYYYNNDNRKRDEIVAMLLAKGASRDCIASPKASY